MSLKAFIIQGKRFHHVSVHTEKTELQKFLGILLCQNTVNLHKKFLFEK